MNKIMLSGRTTRDIEVKYTQGENSMAVARFTLAVKRKGKEKETDFINCVAFGKLGETIDKYVIKGQKILVNGRIQVNPYQDKDGNKRTSTDVIVEDFEFCESKKKEEKEEKEELPFSDVPDEECPF